MKNFIIDLEYKAPIEEIEKHLDPHMDYIHAGRDKGYFISWGPKVPRSGGLIIAQAETREEIEAFAATDPSLSKASQTWPSPSLLRAVKSNKQYERFSYTAVFGL